MKKSDLENGMVVQTRNGNIYLVLKPFEDHEFVLVRAEGYMTSDCYDEYLKVKSDDLKIVNVSYLFKDEFFKIIKDFEEIDGLRFGTVPENNYILDKLDSIQEQLDEVKKMVS